MSYKFQSAKYANPERTAVVAVTEEVGAVALSETDTPEAWAGLLAWASGRSIAEYIAPDARVAPAVGRIADLAATDGRVAALEARLAKLEAASSETMK